LPPFDGLVQPNISKKLIMVNCDNRAKNWPKAKSADKFYNLTKSADSFLADFVAKSVCVHAALINN